MERCDGAVCSAEDNDKAMQQREGERSRSLYWELNAHIRTYMYTYVLGHTYVHTCRPYDHATVPLSLHVHSTGPMLTADCQLHLDVLASS